MRSIIEELLAENKRVREKQSTTAVASPMPMIQQHMTTTGGTATASGNADAREHGNARQRSQRDYKEYDRYEGEIPRNDNRTDGGRRSDGKDRREPRYEGDSDRRSGYRSRTVSQTPKDRRRDGKGTGGQHESTNQGRGNGAPCVRHFKYGSCNDPRCLKSHWARDKDECIKYRSSNTCNDVACNFKHTPYNGQPARTISTAVPQQKQLQLMPPPNLVQLGLPYYPQYNNDPGPPAGSPNAIMPPAPPPIPVGKCIFFGKGACKRQNCKLSHEL